MGISDRQANIAGFVVFRLAGIMCRVAAVLLVMTVALASARGDNLWVPPTGVFIVGAPVWIILAYYTAMDAASGRLSGLGIRVNRRGVIGIFPCLDTLVAAKDGAITRESPVAARIVAAGRHIHITGGGYTPTGRFRTPSGSVADPHDGEELDVIFGICVLCNDSDIVKDEYGEWQFTGDPIDAALITMCGKAGITRGEVTRCAQRLRYLPFDRELRMMTTMHRTPKCFVAYTKGDCEAVLESCLRVSDRSIVRSIDKIERQKIMREAAHLSGEGMKVIAFAYKEFDKLPDERDMPDMQRGMTFLGLVGISDPARGDVREVVEVCRNAGIRVVVATEDSREAAEVLRDELGLRSEIMTGAELEALEPADRTKASGRVSVFVRMTSAGRIQLLKLLRRNRRVVADLAMKYDDSARLSDMRREERPFITISPSADAEADITLPGSSLAWIVALAREGRKAYRNVRRMLCYLFPINISLAVFLFLCELLNQGEVMPLWLMIAACACAAPILAVVIACENDTCEVLDHPPDRPGVFPNTLRRALTLTTAAVFTCISGAYIWARCVSETPGFAGSVLSLTIAAAVVGGAFTWRTGRRPIYARGVPWPILCVAVPLFAFLYVYIELPSLLSLGGAGSIGWLGWTAGILFGLAPCAAIEIYRFIRGRRD